jgi:hypothetical protein
MMMSTTINSQAAELALPERKHRRYQRRGACVASTLFQSATIASYDDYKRRNEGLPPFKGASVVEESSARKRLIDNLNEDEDLPLKRSHVSCSCAA